MSLELPNIDLSGLNKAMEDVNNSLAKFAEDMQKRKDNAMAMEFTRVICDLLKENGVMVQMTEIEKENHATNKFEVKYGFAFTGLDFSKHDKIFDDKITKLKKENAKVYQENMHLEEKCVKTEDEIYKLKREIEDLEAIIADGKKPDISVSENGVSVGCECGGYHLAKARIAELEEKLKNACCENQQLKITVDVLSKRIAELMEVHEF